MGELSVRELPLFPLPEVVLFPQEVLPLHIFDIIGLIASLRIAFGYPFLKKKVSGKLFENLSKSFDKKGDRASRE